MCNRCLEADPDRPLVRGEHLIAQLEAPPPWLEGDFVDFIAVRYAPSRAAELIGNSGSSCARSTRTTRRRSWSAPAARDARSGQTR